MKRDMSVETATLLGTALSLRLGAAPLVDLLSVRRSRGGPQCSRVKWIIQICRLTRWWSIYLYIPNFFLHLLSLLSLSAPLLMSAIVAHVGVDSFFLGFQEKKWPGLFFPRLSFFQWTSSIRNDRSLNSAAEQKKVPSFCGIFGWNSLSS